MIIQIKVYMDAKDADDARASKPDYWLDAASVEDAEANLGSLGRLIAKEQAKPQPDDMSGATEGDR